MEAFDRDSAALFWPHFFPKLDFDPGGKLVNVIELFYCYFQSSDELEKIKRLRDYSVSIEYFNIDLKLMQTKLQFPDFVETLKTRPKEVMGCIGTALSVLQSKYNSHKDASVSTSADMPSSYATQMSPIWPRFINLEPHQKFSSLKSDSLGKLVSVIGHVTRVSHSAHLVTSAAFLCVKCERTYQIYFEDGIYAPPAVCPTAKCYNKSLEMLRHKVTSTDVQRIRIQEVRTTYRQSDVPKYSDDTIKNHQRPIDNNISSQQSFNHNSNSTHRNRHTPKRSRIDQNDSTQDVTSALPDLHNSADIESSFMSRTFEVEIRGSYINSCIPGDIVNIIGIVKTTNPERQKASFGKDIGVHQLYIDANSVIKCSPAGRIDPNFISNENINNAQPSPQMASSSLYSHQSNQANRTSGLINLNSANINSTAEYNSFDLANIRQIALNEHCFAWLIASLCPDIFGHEIVKAGLVLGLLGGSDPAKSSNSTSSADSMQREKTMNIRADIHVLVVGDPGMGKSQMLRAAASLSSRSVFVTGHSVSAVGLTAAVGRDSRAAGGDIVIEAGALVLADRGVCCIDELDKIDCDYHALLEAMEQQSVSIAKGGVVTSLRSRAALLAAANPVNGHYNRTKTVQENLKMPTALLSRFDLVFILVDRAELDHDQRLSEHVIRSHLGAQAFNMYKQSREESLSNMHSTHSNQSTNDSGLDTLAQRLRRDIALLGSYSDKLALNYNEQNDRSETQAQSVSNCAVTDDVWANVLDSNHSHCKSSSNDNRSRQGKSSYIPSEMMRKYIEYAKTYVHPYLSRGAAKVLQKQYLTMRAESSFGDTLPVTTRHLESLIRLGQARARAELREEVTEQDALEVVQLLQESLMDAYTTEIGAIEAKGRGGQSLPKQIKAMVAAMKREVEMRGSDVFTRQELEILCTRLRLNRDVDSMIEVLRTECYLLLKGPRQYKLQS